MKVLYQIIIIFSAILIICWNGCIKEDTSNQKHDGKGNKRIPSEGYADVANTPDNVMVKATEIANDKAIKRYEEGKLKGTKKFSSEKQMSMYSNDYVEVINYYNNSGSHSFELGENKLYLGNQYADGSANNYEKK